MKRENNKGFTLVELLAVIVVLAIVMLVVADRVGDAMLKSRGNSLALQVKSLQREMEKVCAMDNKISVADAKKIVESGDLTYLGHGEVKIGTDTLASDVIYVGAKKGSKFANIMATEDVTKLHNCACTGKSCFNESGELKAEFPNTPSTCDNYTVGSDADKSWLRQPSMYFKVSCTVE